MMAEAQGGATMRAIYSDNIARRGHIFAEDPLVAGDRILPGATVPGHRIALSLKRL
ncbi:hypothetical protein ATI53_104912 [Salipiger aestuarii]|uniref:Uncharacterized protein n=1 Tax=Salipiger aestuarii TaxID=568098 RepID=A0A327XST4_9RHOB|nr:hypothetical protein ATI53_104912 [Salipiger aestuarii]